LNFFGIGGFELLLIALVAFLLLGPKGLADGAKTIAKVAKDLRAQRDELTGIVRQAAAEEDEAEKTKTAPPTPEGAVARPAGARPEIAKQAETAPADLPERVSDSSNTSAAQSQGATSAQAVSPVAPAESPAQGGRS
jgi:sec-independent protein translocase protein TatB